MGFHCLTGVDVVSLGDVACDHGDVPDDPVFVVFLRVDRGVRVLGAASTLRRDARLCGVLHPGAHYCFVKLRTPSLKVLLYQ